MPAQPSQIPAPFQWKQGCREGGGGVPVEVSKSNRPASNDLERQRLVPWWYLEIIKTLKTDPIKMHGERSPWEPKSA